jgi:rubredoxin
MARFTDTPQWKTRQAYEKAQASSHSKPKKPRAISVSCPVCGARPRQLCLGRHGQRRHDAHPARIEMAVRGSVGKRAAERRRIAAQKRRWATVTVRFECPVCGGNHSRSDHARAIAVADAQT